MMVVLGTDAHKRSHTVVAVDEAGAEIGSVTVGATPEGHLRLVKWAARWPDRRWAIEDCRALSRRLEADLLRVGELVVRGSTEVDGRCPSLGSYQRQIRSDRRVSRGPRCAAGTGPSRRKVGRSFP